MILLKIHLILVFVCINSMIPVNLYKIAFILKAKHVGKDVVIQSVAINSHSIQKQCMFVALIGKRFDGHNFAEQAVIFGAKALLVNRYLLFLNVPQLIVSDTFRALITLATWVRNQVSPKIITITGSSGKTSVKEMTASILKNCGTVVSTPGNYNNIIGVSLTLLKLTKNSDFAVIELGSSNSGELYQLSKMVAADVALVNNIYPAHLLGFKSLISIKKEKGEIFSGLSNYGQAIINNDNNAFFLWNNKLKKKKILRFSLHYEINVDFFSTHIMCKNDGIYFKLNTPIGINSVFLSMFFGLHNISNALAASAVSYAVGVNLYEIITGLKNMKTIPGRLFPIILNKGKLFLLDDTYNSNIGSMISAIHVLNSMPGYRVLVMSDMLELGESKEIPYHCYIGKLIKRTNINVVFTVGKVSSVIPKICDRGRHFQDKTQLVIYIRKILLLQKQQISMVIKGSRSFCMEKVVQFIKDLF